MLALGQTQPLEHPYLDFYHVEAIRYSIVLAAQPRQISNLLVESRVESDIISTLTIRLTTMTAA